jgi:hypothetical protein
MPRPRMRLGAASACCRHACAVATAPRSSSASASFACRAGLSAWSAMLYSNTCTEREGDPQEQVLCCGLSGRATDQQTACPPRHCPCLLSERQPKVLRNCLICHGDHTPGKELHTPVSVCAGVASQPAGGSGLAGLASDRDPVGTRSCTKRNHRHIFVSRSSPLRCWRTPGA